MKNNHLHKLADSNIIIYLSVSLFLAAVFFSCRFVSAGECTGGLFVNGQLSPRFYPVVNIVLVLLCGLLLQRLNGVFALIRSRTAFPLLFFLLLEGSNPHLTNVSYSGNLLSLIFIVMLFALFSSYQKKEAQREAFGMALCMGCGFLLWSPFIYLMPVFWIGMYVMQSLTGKSFAATLLGLATVGWLAVNGCILCGLPLHTDRFFAALTESRANELHLRNASLYVFFSVILGVICIASNLYNNFNDKTRTRTFNGFINFLSVVSFILIVLRFHETEYALPVLNTCIALQASHLFTNTRKRAVIVLFYVVLVCFFVLYLWSLFRH